MLDVCRCLLLRELNVLLQSPRVVLIRVLHVLLSVAHTQSSGLHWLPQECQSFGWHIMLMRQVSWETKSMRSDFACMPSLVRSVRWNHDMIHNTCHRDSRSYRLTETIHLCKACPPCHRHHGRSTQTGPVHCELHAVLRG